MTDVTYNLRLVEVGEQEVIRVLQECLDRQTNADTLNKQLFRERSDYLSDKKVRHIRTSCHKILSSVNAGVH